MIWSLITVLFALMNFITMSKGTVCQICEGRSEAECLKRAVLLECDLGKICATIVRRNGLIRTILKQCKQREACLSEQKRNWMRISPSEAYKCNRIQRESVCHCCCFDDYCNVNERCAGVDISTQTDVRCEELPELFERGTKRCSRENLVGSVCRFRCNSDHEVNPSYSEEIICQPNGKWDKPVPCCSLPCPPNLYIDLVIMIHNRNHARLLRGARTQLGGFLRRFAIGPSSMRLAYPHYDTHVHEPFIGFQESANLTSDELLNLAIIERTDPESASSVTANTGNALWYIHNNIFNTEYDRPDAKNVIFLITDSFSDDEVGPAARALRESGVTIYTYWARNSFNQYNNEEEFLEISGFYDPKRRDRPSAAHPGHFENLCPNTCNAP